MLRGYIRFLLTNFSLYLCRLFILCNILLLGCMTQATSASRSYIKQSEALSDCFVRKLKVTVRYF